MGTRSETLDVKRILIVEDEVDLSTTLSMAFDMRGYQVAVANSIESAEQVLKGFESHVALIDIRLGDENGIDLIPKLKTIYPKILCVVMTAYAETEIAIQAIHQGAYDFLRKPIDMQQLFVILDRCFRQVWLEQEKQSAEETLTQRNIDLEEINHRLQTLTDDLRESQKNLQTLFDNLEDYLFILDYSGNILRTNPAVSKSLGYSMEQLASGMAILDILSSESKERAKNFFEEPEAKQNLPLPWHLETMQQNKVPVEIKFSFGTWGGQQVLFGIARDISLRLKAEEAFRQNEIRSYQSQKMEAIGTLAGGIAHDFNNILQGIFMTTENLHMEPDMDDEYYEKLDKIIRFGKRGADLVSQILTFSRQGSLQQKPVKLSSIIREILKMVRATLPSSIKIEQDLDVQCPKVLGNPTQLYQIFLNLCTNAEYAMRNKGGTLYVSLKEIIVDSLFSKNINLKEGSYNKLIVQDTGGGIVPEIKARIFEPFFTTKPTGEGTGMGLAVVHGIVQAHGGAIQVESIINKYTTFEIFLPSITNEKQHVNTKAPVFSESGNESILLVDDEVEVSQMMRNNLTRFGYNVTLTHEGSVAFELFSKDPHKFDLVVTDQTMPNISGDILAKKLLKTRPDLPIILITGFSSQLLLLEAENFPTIKVLMKPVEANYLNQTIREILNSKE